MLATMNTRPLSLWHGLHDDMERWLSAPVATAAQRWMPSVDVVEAKDHYLFHADLPGVELDQIEVLFEDGLLTIKGERNENQRDKEHSEEKEIEEKGYRRIERSYGSFQRSFRLPDAIDADNITAKGDKGVLEVRVPKQEKAHRKIQIQG